MTALVADGLPTVVIDGVATTVIGEPAGTPSGTLRSTLALPSGQPLTAMADIVFAAPVPTAHMDLAGVFRPGREQAP